jgi:hypothetical protein
MFMAEDTRLDRSASDMGDTSARVRVPVAGGRGVYLDRIWLDERKAWRVGVGEKEEEEE